jgi:uncharacterized protein (TIGR01777 family)
MAEQKRAAVTGVTGFIGRGLPAWLAARGFATTGVSRAGNGDVAGVDRWQKPAALDFSGHAAVIHLSGEPINQRWTDEAKRKFRASRVDATRQVVDAIRKLPADQRPAVLVSGSAVGIYGDRGDEFLTESSPPAAGYLAELCRDWEAVAFEAESLGVRVVTLRTGVVLGNGGAAFEQLRSVFKWGIGGRLGDGRQWMPWIHLDDLRAAIVHAVLSETLAGPVNGSAPQPERNADFTKKFAAALHRPALFTVPGFALKIAFGEFSEALLFSQRAVPSALVADGFEFRFPVLEQAFVDLLESA